MVEQGALFYDLPGCILCLSNESDIIDIGGELGLSLNISTMITKHFWLDIEKYTFKNVCQSCCNKMTDFHQFYSTIEDTHKTFYWKSNKSDLDIKIRAEDIKLEPILFHPLLEDENTLSGDAPAVIENFKIENSSNFEEEFQNDYYSNDSIDDDVPLAKQLKLRKSKKQAETPANKLPRKRRVKKDDTQSPQQMEKIKKEDEQIREFCKMKCDICADDFDTFHEVRQHYRKSHQQEGYIECCGKRYTRRHRILEHILVHLNPHLFRCDVCNKNYANQQSLYNHNISLHTPSELRAFKCDKCPKSFAKNYLLVAHQVQHMSAEDKKFICSQCDRAFPTNYILTQHVRQVHEAANALMCDICSKVLKSKATFILHRKEHIEAAKIQCTICASWLKNRSTMRRHMKAHEQENGLFVCDICGKQSPNREALLKHKSYLHRMERKHKCNLCDKAFKRALNLKEHMATHTGAVLYRCLFCDKTFNSSANMHSHKKKIHFREWEEGQRIK